MVIKKSLKCIGRPEGYGFGEGIPPLDLEKAHAANLEQYRRARKCYESYRKLLATGMKAMPLAS